MVKRGRIKRDFWLRYRFIEDYESGRVETTNANRNQYESDIVTIGDKCASLLRSEFGELVEALTNDRALKVLDGSDKEINSRNNAEYIVGAATGLRMGYKSILQWAQRAEDVKNEKIERKSQDKGQKVPSIGRYVATDDQGV